MNEILTKALNIVILVFLVSTMLGCGLSLTFKQIIAPLRSVRLALLSAIVSYLLIPLLAVIISKLLGLEEPLKIGLVLCSMSAGAEAGPKLVGIAKGNVAFSVGLLTAQLGVTIVYIPLVFSLLLPEVRIDHFKLLSKLCGTVAVPMLAGLFLRSRHEGIADRVSPYIHKISSSFMFLLVGLIVLSNYDGIIQLLGSGAILAALIFIPVSFTMGYLLGGPEIGTRKALAVMSGARNSCIALMIASQVFSDPKILMMIIVTVLLMLFLLIPTAFWYGRRGAEEIAQGAGESAAKQGISF